MTIAEADAHRAVAAGVQPRARIEVRQLGAADVHRAGALAADDRVLRRPGGDVAQQPVVTARCRVVGDLRCDQRRVLGRLLGDRRAPRRLLRIEPLPVLQRLIELPDDRLAVADQRDLGRLVLVHRLRLDVELDDAHVLVVARRQAEMHDPVEARAHQEHDIGLLQREAARRADRQRMVVRHHALAHRRGEERQLRRSMNARTSSSAREKAMPLPMMTSGRSADCSTFSA